MYVTRGARTPEPGRQYPRGMSAARTVVITGSTQGLGYAYAREFVRRGCNVVLCGRDEARVQDAVVRLQAEVPPGAGIAGRACDTYHAAQVQALWDFAVERFGRVDIWVNNAGYARTAVPFADTKPREIEAMVRTNVVGTMNATQVAFAGMKAQGAGRIYLTLGGGAKGRVVPGMSVYSTTKRALKYFADCIVREAKGSGVAIGTISPGVNITEGMLREIAEVPAGRRASLLKPLNFIGEHVETTAPWIVERILADTGHGTDITWLTTGRLLKRSLEMMRGRRDVLSRYGLGT
jgi:short-subunit dehydrogenase